MKTETSVKIYKDVKAAVQKVANSTGLTLSALVNGLLRQMAATGRIKLYAPEQMTPKLDKFRKRGEGQKRERYNKQRI